MHRDEERMLLLSDAEVGKGYRTIKEELIDMQSEDAFVNPNSARVESISIFGVLLNAFFMLFLLPILAALYTVEPQQHACIVFMGSLAQVVTTPGLHWFPALGRTIKYVPTSTQSMDIKKTTVVDRNGNPIVVAGVVTFVLTGTVKAAFVVLDYRAYIEKQAFAVLKRVCSMYPYECKTGKSLQSETGEVCKTMVALLQERANACGATIIGYELTDLQYAPEIAAGMLVRQQAQALVEARFTIVEGAVNIVTDAVERLRDKGISFRDQEQTKLISTLLAVICGDAHVTPTFSISENVGDEKQNSDTQRQTMELLSRIALNTTPRTN